jgi:hypothetical protein
MSSFRTPPTRWARVANELGAYVPKAMPNEPMSEVVILISAHDRSRFASPLSRYGKRRRCGAQGFDQHGPRAA